MSIQQHAERIFAQLTPEQIAYAADPARGEYRGFAALHDLFDANDLLPEPEVHPCDSNGSGEQESKVQDHADLCNAIMNAVSKLICASS